MSKSTSFKKNMIQNEEKNPKSIQILTGLINMIYFGFAIAMLVIGLLYLTIYKYQYSFTRFNLTMMSGICITFGVLIIVSAILNIVLIQLNRKKQLLIVLAVSSLLIFCLFLIIFALAIWGLALQSDDDSLSKEIRANILYSIKNYDNNSPQQEETAQMNWLQTTFHCCGIDSASG